MSNAEFALAEETGSAERDGRGWQGMQITEEDKQALFRVKLTLHRITIIASSIAFIVPKALAAYRNQGVVTITLDWLYVLVVGLILWWFSLYESVEPPIWIWWLHTDYSRETVLLVLTFVITFGTTLLYAYARAGESRVLECMAWMLFLLAVFAILPIFYILLIACRPPTRRPERIWGWLPSVGILQLCTGYAAFLTAIFVLVCETRTGAAFSTT